MTCITFKAGMMAADSAWTSTGGLLAHCGPKLWRNRHGVVMAGAGDGDDRAFREMMENVSHPGEVPTAAELARITPLDMSTLLWFPATDALWLVDLEEKRCGAEPTGIRTEDGHLISALGAANEPALGALMVPGVHAAEAVRLTCLIHRECRLPVMWMTSEETGHYPEDAR